MNTDRLLNILTLGAVGFGAYYLYQRLIVPKSQIVDPRCAYGPETPRGLFQNCPPNYQLKNSFLGFDISGICKCSYAPASNGTSATNVNVGASGLNLGAGSAGSGYQTTCAPAWWNLYGIIPCLPAI